MYDELVKQLRNEAESPDNYPEDSALMREAADAIEELSAAVEGYESSTNMALVEKDGETVIEFQSKWIPVTERLPEPNVPCLVYNKYYGPMVGWRVDGERFRIPGSRFPDHPTHWMPLPQAPKEET